MCRMTSSGDLDGYHVPDGILWFGAVVLFDLVQGLQNTQRSLKTLHTLIPIT